MSLSFNPPPSARPTRVDEPTTMPMPHEPVAWRRWADAMPDICLWIAPSTGRIVDCNRALFGSLGFSRTEVFGWPLQALAEPRNLAAAGDTWRSLAAGQVVRDADCTLRSRHGTEVAVSAAASPVHNAGGKLVAGLVVMRDITERCRREQTLQTRKKQLKTLAFELTVAESHERSRIALDLQRNIGEVLARARSTLQHLNVTAAGHAAQVAELQDLLASAMRSTDAAAAELACPALPSTRLQPGIERLAQQLTREGPLIVRVEGQVPDAMDVPDATRAVILRVLRELARNATQHAKARHLWFRVRAEPQRLCIVVGDDGAGFDVSRLPGRADASGGHGLFASDAQMQAVGGRLVVQSKPGRGTRAMLVVPLMAVAPPTQAP